MTSSNEKSHGIAGYLIVYSALMLLLVATVAAAHLDLGSANTAISLSIAIVKAILVILFFMHVRQSSWMVWIFSGAAFLWLCIMLGLTMADYSTRGLAPEAKKGLVLPAAHQIELRENHPEQIDRD